MSILSQLIHAESIVVNYWVAVAGRSRSHRTRLQESRSGIAVAGLAAGVCALLLFCTVGAFAADRVWVGAAGGDWDLNSNWLPDGVPQANDNVAINSGSVSLTNSTAYLSSFSISNATLTFSDWMTTLSAADIDIKSNGVLTHTICDTAAVVYVTNRVYLIGTNLTIHAGGKINASQKGYRLKQGPGYGGSSSQGGCHGGLAGRMSSGTYGSYLFPEDPGSGGHAGHAGGAVKITATGGTVCVNGIIEADTVYAQEGPGSGGSVLIECRVFDGTGFIQANGGTAKTGGNGSGGGGGRIAIYYNTVAQAQEAPGATSITIMASGGAGTSANYGRPGTVYLPDMTLLQSPNFNISGNIIFADGSAAWSPDVLVLKGRQVELPENFELNVAQDLSILYSGTGVGIGSASLMLSGALRPQDLAGSVFISTGLLYYTFTYTNPQPLKIGGDFTMDNRSAVILMPGETNASLGKPYGGWLDISGDLVMKSSSTLHPYSVSSNGGSVMISAKNILVESDSMINASSKGFAAKTGPGTAGAAKGAGYGGCGGNNGGPAYGSAICPVEPGSGGNGGPAAGLVWLVTDGGTVRIDGTIDASSSYAQEGAGSGGGIVIVCKKFEGGGILKADGGNAAANKGAGAGGRIGVLRMKAAAYERARIGVTNSMDFVETQPDSFTGTLSVNPGTGIAPGAELGTIRFGTFGSQRIVIKLR